MHKTSPQTEETQPPVQAEPMTHQQLAQKLDRQAELLQQILARLDHLERGTMMRASASPRPPAPSAAS